MRGIMKTMKLKLTIEGTYEYTRKDAAEDYFPREIPGREKLIEDELEWWKEHISSFAPELANLKVELKEVRERGK
jgi:hypothetical protein